MIRFKQYIEEAEAGNIISKANMKAFENVVDKLFAKYKLDFKFTNHFRERMSDKRNKPHIEMKELANMIKKLYAKYKGGDNSLAKYRDVEAVLKDLQSDLNLPIAVEYDRKNDELDVIAKTIMRKKNFTSPDPFIRL